MTEPQNDTEQTETDQTETEPQTSEGETGKDPSNTPVEELTSPLDPDDDVHDRIALVNTSRPEDLRGADQ